MVTTDAVGIPSIIVFSGSGSGYDDGRTSVINAVQCDDYSLEFGAAPPHWGDSGCGLPTELVPVVLNGMNSYPGKWIGLKMWEKDGMKRKIINVCHM